MQWGKQDQERLRQRIAGRCLLGRADAGARVGWGHAARMGALLEAWRELGGQAVLLGQGIQGGLRQRLLDGGVELVEGPGPPADLVGPGAPEDLPPAGPADLAGTLALAQRLGACALACDGYAFGARYQAALERALPLLAVDDLAAFPPVASVVLNQNMGFDPARYGGGAPGGPAPRLLVGEAYALLRAELRQARARLDTGAVAPAPRGGPLRRVLLAFGGSDPAGLSAPMATALGEALGPDVELLLVVGGSLPPPAALALEQALARPAATGARLRVLRDLPALAELLLSCDLAVLAAGATTWEALALGVPPLVVAVAANQRAVVQGLALRGLGEDLGPPDADLPRRAALRVARRLADAQALRQAALAGMVAVDGRGVWRVLDALLSAVESREASA